ncbi:hypothetical protein C0991_008133 [Blastosporella zonata]|nr:hypothetical protein C0991_008133 [Blastosporella zonata]
MSIAKNPTLSLSAISDSFPFQTKYISLPQNVTIPLGAEVDSDSGRTRVASATNGWFAPQKLGGGSAISPLPLSSSHANVWWDGLEVYLRDIDSPFGTYVNNVKVTGTRVIRAGDIIVRVPLVIPLDLTSGPSRVSAPKSPEITTRPITSRRTTSNQSSQKLPSQA